MAFNLFKMIGLIGVEYLYWRTAKQNRMDSNQTSSMPIVDANRPVLKDYESVQLDETG